MAKHGVGPEVFPSQCLLFKNGRTKQYFERISELHLYSRYFGVIPTLVTSQEWREEPGNRHFVMTFAKRQLFSSPFIRAIADHGRSLVLLTYTFPYICCLGDCAPLFLSVIVHCCPKCHQALRKVFMLHSHLFSSSFIPSVICFIL